MAQIRTGDIYRYVSGAFFTVIAVSCLEIEGKVHEIVVLKSLNKRGNTVTYTVEDFLQEVPDSMQDLLGQKYLFVQVDDTSNSLSETSTEALIEELKNRTDNPYAQMGEPNVFDVYYEVGVYKPYPRKDLSHRGEVYFEPIVSKNTLEEAILFIKRHMANSERSVIMRVSKVVEDIN